MINMTNEELFICVVKRINEYLIIMGVFFFIYFMLNTKVNVYLFLLALLNVAFALLSYQHLRITDRLASELHRARSVLSDVSKETRKMHQG